MAEKVIGEIRFVETDDGFRIEVKGDKERIREHMGDPHMWGSGFGRRRGAWGWKRGKHGRWGHGPGGYMGFGPWSWWGWCGEGFAEDFEEGEPEAPEKPPKNV